MSMYQSVVKPGCRVEIRSAKQIDFLQARELFLATGIRTTEGIEICTSLIPSTVLHTSTQKATDKQIPK